MPRNLAAVIVETKPVETAPETTVATAPVITYPDVLTASVMMDRPAIAKWEAAMRRSVLQLRAGGFGP